MKVLNSDDYFVFKQEDYDEYLEWKSTLSDWELKEGFRFLGDCYDYETHKITFSQKQLSKSSPPLLKAS